MNIVSNMGAGIGFDIDGDSENGRWTARIDWAAGAAQYMRDGVRAEMVGSGESWLEALYVAVAKAYRESERDLATPAEPGAMSLEQLIELRNNLYKKAVQDKLFDKLSVIYSVLGSNESIYADKKYSHGGLVIKAVSRLEVTYNGRLVAARGSRSDNADGLFVPGAWVGIVDMAYDLAEAEKARRDNDAKEAKRQELLKTLGLT